MWRWEVFRVKEFLALACDLPNARHCQLRKKQEQFSQASKLEAEVFLSSEPICGVLLHLEIKLIYCVFLLEFLPSNNLFQSNHRLCAHRAGRRQTLLQKTQDKNKLLKLLLKQPLRLSIFVLQKSGAWLIVSGYSRAGLLETEPSFPKPPLLNLPLLTRLQYKITRSQVLITHILQWFLRAQYCWNLRESHQESRPLKRPGFDVVFGK